MPVAQLSYEEFVAELRSALHYLYDPYQLRRSALVNLLGVEDRFDAPLVLQRILTEAIQSLEPAQDEPPQSRAWRIYEVLLYQYVRQLDADALGNQMGLSARQLRRERRAGVEALADLLWKEYLGNASGASAVPSSDENTADSPSSELDQDLSWALDASPDITADVSACLLTVRQLVQPLSREHGVAIRIDVDGELPEVAVHPVVCRQMILNLLSVTIPDAKGGSVSVTARLDRREVAIAIRSADASTWEQPLAADPRRSIDLVGRLAQACGGRAQVCRAEGVSAAVLVLPALGHLPVLAIDDNADMLQLFQRYAAGTRYHIVPTQRPEHALQLIEREAPRIIILDVMMPEMDGLQVLACLRENPTIRDIPIVVCTILPQEALVRSLGADAFLLKPVSQRDLLNTLDSLSNPSP